MLKKCVYAKTEIISVLSILNKEYNHIYNVGTLKSIKLMKAYAKMAVIALGGWLEDGQQELAQLSIIKLRENENQHKLSEMLDNIYGFSYSSHFSKSLILAFGAHGFEYIKSQVGDANIQILSSVLGNLKQWRDSASHSYVTLIPCNPSRVINEMNRIFPILKKIEKSARDYKNQHFL